MREEKYTLVHNSTSTSNTLNLKIFDQLFTFLSVSFRSLQNWLPERRWLCRKKPKRGKKSKKGRKKQKEKSYRKLERK